METELVEEIDKLFNKYTNELKSKIMKLIVKHEKKIIKDSQKSQKIPVSKVGGNIPQINTISTQRRRGKKIDYENDSDI